MFTLVLDSEYYFYLHKGHRLTIFDDDIVKYEHSNWKTWLNRIYKNEASYVMIYNFKIILCFCAVILGYF